MLELHDKPNEAWYARQLADGGIVLNPGDPQALEKLRKNHPTLAAAFEADDKKRKVLRKLRRLLRRHRTALLPSNRDEFDDLIKEINDVEPDVAE